MPCRVDDNLMTVSAVVCANLLVEPHGGHIVDWDVVARADTQRCKGSRDWVASIQALLRPSFTGRSASTISAHSWGCLCAVNECVRSGRTRWAHGGYAACSFSPPRACWTHVSHDGRGVLSNRLAAGSDT